MQSYLLLIVNRVGKVEQSEYSTMEQLCDYLKEYSKNIDGMAIGDLNPDYSYQIIPVIRD